MYRHVKELQFEAKPEKPDALYAMKLQELIGGQFGELTVTLQYMFQGANCRMPGKYKDMILDIGAEELGHVEMISVMIARLLEGAPSETTAEAAAANPALAAILGGMNPQHAIVSGGGALPANSQGVPWSGAYIVASGNLLTDFRSNAAAEGQGRLQTSRLYNMTDDPGVKAMLQYNLARDTYHQQQWLLAIEQLVQDGLCDVIEDSNADIENAEYNHTLFQNEVSTGADGRWAQGPSLVGNQQLDAQLSVPFTDDVGLLPAPDPKLFATYDGNNGPGVEGDGGGIAGPKGVVDKLKDAVTGEGS
ncbi:manganese catalase family protein [uncultured Jatrophihabitans sp.]|uniref:manganese catalase family protein n=1 Tax=uncultured Jatrophihabitans sp. TaxID=1610747 RepID=UPI0035C98AB9